MKLHWGLSQFSRRNNCCHTNTPNRRENGTVPLVREGDRSMFSAKRLFTKYVCWPKNGPVPGLPGTVTRSETDDAIPLA
jgi:hypothetical protein